MPGLDGVFGEPNWPAFEKREERYGPPLSYIHGKMAHSLRELHDAVRSIQRYVPEDPPERPADGGTPYPLKAGYLLGPAKYAFHLQLVAYLALGNMLGLAADPSGLTDRLLRLDRDEFKEWIEGVERGASVTG